MDSCGCQNYLGGGGLVEMGIVKRSFSLAQNEATRFPSFYVFEWHLYVLISRMHPFGFIGPALLLAAKLSFVSHLCFFFIIHCSILLVDRKSNSHVNQIDANVYCSEFAGLGVAEATLSFFIIFLFFFF